MKAKIISLPGDGIGPEVMRAGVAVLETVAEQFGHDFEIEEHLIGGAAIDAVSAALPKQTIEACRAADAIMLGAVGGPKWADPEMRNRPEYGLLQLRSVFGFFANLRPVVPLNSMRDASPLRPELLNGVDIMVVRELTGGIYFGDKIEGIESAQDTCNYTREEVERVVRVAARLAQKRRKHLTSVDKSNVLATSRLWRSVTTRVMQDEFPDVTVEHLLVDAAAMHLIARPSQFDVIVTENMFGDILTDEASMLVGSMGLLPSASLGAQGNRALPLGLYEPIHGSAPDIAGKGIANPCGMIASIAMMLRHSLGLEKEAAAVELAIKLALDAGNRTADLGSKTRTLSTDQMARAIIAQLTI